MKSVITGSFTTPVEPIHPWSGWDVGTWEVLGVLDLGGLGFRGLGV